MFHFITIQQKNYLLISKHSEFNYCRPVISAISSRLIFKYLACVALLHLLASDRRFIKCWLLVLFTTHSSPLTLKQEDKGISISRTSPWITVMSFVYCNNSYPICCYLSPCLPFWQNYNPTFEKIYF